jgi:hypothetical protein
MAFAWPRATTLDVYYSAGSQALRPSEVTGIDRFLETRTDRAGLSFSTAMLTHLIGSTTFFVGNATNLTPTTFLKPSPGHVLDATATLSIRISSAFTLDGSYLVDRLEDARTRRTVYSNGIIRMRLANQFSRALSARAIVQYDRLTVNPSETLLRPIRRLNYDVLVAYVASGTAVYLGANYDLATFDPQLEVTPVGLPRSQTLSNDGWQVFAKMSCLVRR